MSVEVQLRDTLNRRAPDTSDKTRNVDLIMYYFGFGGVPWPTYEEIYGVFGVGTGDAANARSRVGQILKNYFRTRVRAADVPALEDCYDLVRRKGFWTHSELTAEILKSGIAGDNFHIEGLFDLMKEVGLAGAYGVYPVDLKPLTGPKPLSRQQSVRRNTGQLILTKLIAGRLGKYLKEARSKHGKFGLAELNALAKVEGESPENFEELKPILRYAIEQAVDSWVHEQDGKVWFTFETTGENAIRNYSDKVFSIVHQCNVDRLAVIFHNALDRGYYRPEVPPIEVLRQYFEKSKRYKLEGNLVAYAVKTDETLEPFERDLVEFLRERERCSYSELRQYLESRRHQSPKRAFNSPLVYVDKQGRTRGNYRLIFVGALETSEPPDDYTLAVERLRSLGPTDKYDVGKERSEQAILSEWLFKGKDRTNCALCGEEYPVSALWTAHKKKRAECSEKERKDPYVVMPLCLFGCDFLYEKRHVKVVDGRVAEGEPLGQGGAASRYRNSIIGNCLKPEWLRGSPSYFD